MTGEFWVYDDNDSQMGDPVIAESHDDAARFAALRAWDIDPVKDCGCLTVSDADGVDVRRFTFAVRFVCEVEEESK